jgi:hypothetical protein
MVGIRTRATASPAISPGSTIASSADLASGATDQQGRRRRLAAYVLHHRAAFRRQTTTRWLID